MKEIITEKYDRSMTGVDLVAWRPCYNYEKLIVDVVSSKKRETVNLMEYLMEIYNEKK